MFCKLGDLFNFNQTEGANFPVLFYPFPQQIVALVVVVVLPHVADYIIIQGIVLVMYSKPMDDDDKVGPDSNDLLNHEPDKSRRWR